MVLYPFSRFYIGGWEKMWLLCVFYKGPFLFAVIIGELSGRNVLLVINSGYDFLEMFRNIQNISTSISKNLASNLTEVGISARKEEIFCLSALLCGILTRNKTVRKSYI